MVVLDITEVTFVHIGLDFEWIGIIGCRVTVFQGSALEKIVKIQQIIGDPRITHSDGLLNVYPLVVYERFGEHRALLPLPLSEIPPVNEHAPEERDCEITVGRQKTTLLDLNRLIFVGTTNHESVFLHEGYVCVDGVVVGYVQITADRVLEIVVFFAVGYEIYPE